VPTPGRKGGREERREGGSWGLRREEEDFKERMGLEKTII